jgi:hypothetical protein
MAIAGIDRGHDHPINKFPTEARAFKPLIHNTFRHGVET